MDTVLALASRWVMGVTGTPSVGLGVGTRVGVEAVGSKKESMEQ